MYEIDKYFFNAIKKSLVLMKCNLSNKRKLSSLLKCKGYMLSQFFLVFMDKESSKLEMIIISSKNINIKQAFI